jgi:mediator of RNA polymerase II transcription subunit 7
LFTVFLSFWLGKNNRKKSSDEGREEKGVRERKNEREEESITIITMPSVSSKSPFPPPPEFYKLYGGVENEREEDKTNEKKKSLPPLPPLIPKRGETYETFGATHADPSTLLAPELLSKDPDFPLQKLYVIVPQNEEDGDKKINAHKTEIQNLNKQTLERFAALANDLQNAPSRTNERIEEIALLYNNLHHLLNTIRPLQARETVAFVLKEQIEEKRKALRELQESLK